MTNREKQILQLLKNNVLIQQQEIAITLGISRSAVAGHIMGLINKGYVRGRGYILSEHQAVENVSADYTCSSSLSVCITRNS